MMSLTSSVTPPPNSMWTVESGWEPAGADAGLAVKLVIEKSASAEAGAISIRRSAATAAPATQTAPPVDLISGSPALDFTSTSPDHLSPFGRRWRFHRQRRPSLPITLVPTRYDADARAARTRRMSHPQFRLLWDSS